MMPFTQHRIQLRDRIIKYRTVRSKSARKLRVRVGPDGVEVVQPDSRNSEEVTQFLVANETWIISQLQRVEQSRAIRRPPDRLGGEILFRGERTPVRIKVTKSNAAGNAVELLDGKLIVSRGPGSRTPVSRSVEFWLRRQARRAIEGHLDAVTARLGERPTHVYVMGQRTKWGNCSARRNLSFNWRLILAPDYVLRYLVTHETVHLAVPDHSPKFWLTVQSLCRDSERARQWLAANGKRLRSNPLELT